MQVGTSTRRVVPGRQASSLYLISWVAVAAFGLGYIGVATTRPDLIGTVLPLAEHQMDQSSGGRQPGDLAEEMVVLRKWVHELQHELAAAKSTLHEQVGQNAVILQRLSVAEERLGAPREVRDPVGKVPAGKAQTRAQLPVQIPVQTPVQTAQQQVPTAASSVPEAPQRTVSSPAWSPEVAAATNTNVRIMNSVAAPIATGSVPETAVKTPPVPASPRSIEIGTADSLDSLRSKWGEIAGRNGDVLADASPRYRLSADGRSVPFTLLAGPFQTPADATRACNALRAKGIACRVGGAYTGNTL
jgi:hypothetical protein